MKSDAMANSDDVIVALANAFAGPKATGREIHTCRESLYALRRLVQQEILLEMNADFRACTTNLTLKG